MDEETLNILTEKVDKEGYKANVVKAWVMKNQSNSLNHAGLHFSRMAGSNKVFVHRHDDVDRKTEVHFDPLEVDAFNTWVKKTGKIKRSIPKPPEKKKKLKEEVMDQLDEATIKAKIGDHEYHVEVRSKKVEKGFSDKQHNFYIHGMHQGSYETDGQDPKRNRAEVKEVAHNIAHGYHRRLGREIKEENMTQVNENLDKEFTTLEHKIVHHYPKANLGVMANSGLTHVVKAHAIGSDGSEHHYHTYGAIHGRDVMRQLREKGMHAELHRKVDTRLDETYAPVMDALKADKPADIAATFNQLMAPKIAEVLQATKAEVAFDTFGPAGYETPVTEDKVPGETTVSKTNLPATDNDDVLDGFEIWDGVDSDYDDGSDRADKFDDDPEDLVSEAITSREKARKQGYIHYVNKKKANPNFYKSVDLNKHYMMGYNAAKNSKVKG